MAKTNLNIAIGKQLVKIRGKITQSKFIEKLDLISSMSRPYYSMIETGERSASLPLLDMVACEEKISFDFLFGIHDNFFDPRDYRYQEFIEIWSTIDTVKRDRILKYAKQIKQREGN